MDKERPTLRRLQSLPKSGLESIGTIRRELIDPRAVPRWIPPAQDTRSLQSPLPQRDSSSSRPDEERHLSNYATRLPPTHKSACESGQSLSGEVSGSQQTTVGSESTQSEAKWAARPSSTTSTTKSPPGRGRELHPLGAANNGTTYSSTILEHLTGVSEPHRHEEGLSCNHVPLQHGSCGDADRGLVPEDPLLPRAAQTEGQSRSPPARITRGSHSNVRDGHVSFQLQNSNTSPYCNVGNTPNDAKGFRVVRKSPSDSGASTQSSILEPSRSVGDNDSKPEICQVVGSSDPVDPVPTPSTVATLTKRDCEISDPLGSIASTVQDQESTRAADLEPTLVLACLPDGQQRLLRRTPSTEGNDPDQSGRSRGEPSRWTPRNTDSSLQPAPEDVKVPRDAALLFLKLEFSRMCQESPEPGLLEADPLVLPSNPLHRENGQDSSGSSAPSSPLSTPGLDAPTTQDGQSSKGSTVSTDPSEYGESEDTLPKDRPNPGAMVPNALTEDLIICVLLGWLYVQVVLRLLSQVEHMRTRPGESGSVKGSRSGNNYSVTGYPFPQHTNGSIRRERDDGRGDEGDDQSRWPEQRTQKLDDSPPRTPRRLACPFHKFDPERYSAFNEAEKEYRICSSGYWPDISRLKQHLYRTHLRPEFYCRRCYVVFEEEIDYDNHCRQETPCVCQLERQFQEKMSDQQMTLIKKKRPGKDPRDSWNEIFRFLFPGANIPENPYFESPEQQMRRKFPEQFGREFRSILSSLLQQNLPPALTVEPEVLDQICDTATTQALQRVASGSGTEITPRQPHPNVSPNRHLGEAHPANPHIQDHFGTYMHQSQVEMVDDNRIQMQHCPPIHYYPLLAQPGGSMGPDSYYSDMSSTGSIIPTGYQPSVPAQPDLRVPGAAFDRALAEFQGHSDQTPFPIWNPPY